MTPGVKDINIKFAYYLLQHYFIRDRSLTFREGYMRQTLFFQHAKQKSMKKCYLFQFLPTITVENYKIKLSMFAFFM